MDAQAARRPFDVLKYTATIQPDLARRSITGDVTITFTAAIAGLRTVEFDSGDLRVDAVRASGRAVPFSQHDHHVTLVFPTALPVGTPTAVQVQYVGLPKRGVSYLDAPEQVYAGFATSEWLVCVDDPSDKASLDLTVVVPTAWTVEASGTAGTVTPVLSGLTAHRFSLTEPASTYTFGFVAGQLGNRVTEQVGPDCDFTIALDRVEPFR